MARDLDRRKSALWLAKRAPVLTLGAASAVGLVALLAKPLDIDIGDITLPGIVVVAGPTIFQFSPQATGTINSLGATVSGSSSTSAAVTVPGGFFQNQPAGWTQIVDYDFSGVFPFTSNLSNQSGNIAGTSPTINVEDWGHVVLGPHANGLDSISASGMYSGPTTHVQSYPTGFSSGIGPSTYQLSLGATYSRIYAAVVIRYDDPGGGYEHNTQEKLFYFRDSGGNTFYCGTQANDWGCEQLGADFNSGVLVSDSDGEFVEFAVCVDPTNTKLYLNGSQIASVARTPPSFTGLQISGTYGGGSPATKTQDDHRHIDHLRVAAATSGSCS